MLILYASFTMSRIDSLQSTVDNCLQRFPPRNHTTMYAGFLTEMTADRLIRISPDNGVAELVDPDEHSNPVGPMAVLTH